MLSMMVCILCISACQLEKLKDPIVITNNIEKEFYLDLEEYLHPTNRQLRFLVSTIEDQECLNTTIDLDYLRVGSTVQLSIIDIVEAADCQAGIAPASSEKLAGQLPPGAYSFEVSLRNTVVNKGQLLVNADNYIIRMETQEGIVLLHNNLRHVPEQAFWGYIICREDQQAELAAELQQRLSPLANEADYRSGYYGHFEINNNVGGMRKVFLTRPPEADFHFSFLFDLAPDATDVRLEALLDGLREDFPHIILRAYNAAGRIF